MATIVKGTVPAADLALHHALESLSGVEVECERVVRSGDEAVMPLLWVRYADRDEVEPAFAADPTVRSVTCLYDSGTDNEMLYRMDWVDRVGLLLRMLTNSEATVLDAYGRRGRWEFRLLYPEREEFSETHQFCEGHGLSFDVVSIRESAGEPAGRFGLTECQYRALVLAVQRGYYEVPRGTTLEELADELEVSHQALSERLRRATGSLVGDAVPIGALTDTVDEW